MNIEIIIARVIISILNSGYIDEKCVEEVRVALDNFDSKLEIFNAISVSHKKRYIQCFTDELRKAEYRNFVKDYSVVFGNDFIDVDLVRDLFSLMITVDFHSFEFQTLCGNIIEHLNKCGVPEVKYAIFSHMISVIIKSRTYGKQPIDTYLQECVDGIDNMLLEFGEIRKISLLE